MNETLKNIIEAAVSAAEAKKGFNVNMIMGLDGFVDEIIHPVATRMDFENFTRIKTIGDLGARISNAAGLSTNIELVTTSVKLGGNGPIMANALLELGAELSYVGALGKPDIHPVFKPMTERCKQVFSLTDPGHTDALEFEDGKLMLGKHFSLKEINWQTFKEGLGGVSAIAGMIEKSNMFGMENWTMMPHMSEVWEGIINEVFPLLPEKQHKSVAFFDLADPEKRTKEDISKAMSLIGRFEEKFETTLGLNQKELYEIAEVLGVESDSNDIVKTGNAVHKKLNIHCLVVHLVKEAYSFCGGESHHIDGPFCASPKLTTGAGDNFNAGFCLGLTLGIDKRSCLAMGVGTSGFYVRNARSANFDELIGFLNDWKNGCVTD